MSDVNEKIAAVARVRELTPQEVIWRDLDQAARLGAEILQLEAAVTQLKAAIAAEAAYENRKVLEVLFEHPLYLKIDARRTEIREELLGLV